MKKELLVFGSLLCLVSGIGAVRAQTCATPPSCASLGYTMTSSDCSGQPTLVCPFDASAVFCAGTASSGGAGGSTSMPAECNGNCVKQSGHWFLYEEMGVLKESECDTKCRSKGMHIPGFPDHMALCSVADRFWVYDLGVAGTNFQFSNFSCDTGSVGHFESTADLYDTYEYTCVCIKEI